MQFTLAQEVTFIKRNLQKLELNYKNGRQETKKLLPKQIQKSCQAKQ